ncbi:response regulator transcription factor [Sporolactobacillus sp. CPB3-1]|uniref:Response regulator transcription factor n=1 Tax=Sporolactobacillus mangiferae TaxID=2940498 RepID=A0ABT0M755_9BACL|nr:response regulator transcription factor [Sporolactobacillus mangiferae]MCL1630689.1 response regulator transcription factor [Sporolactobacillus mangiferae]
MTEKIRVMLVDDHDMVRKGLKAYLATEESIEWVGEASSGNEAVRIFAALNPEIILMDLIMEDGDGIEATKQILTQDPSKKIIILTSFYDDEQVFPAIEAGAMSYLLKTASSDEIIETIYKAHRGKTVIDGKVAQKLVSGMHRNRPFDQLTTREKEVLQLIAEGKSNAEIADLLFIGIKTVKTHVSSIFSKLEVADRTQAAIYAFQNHLFTKHN